MSALGAHKHKGKGRHKGKGTHGDPDEESAGPIVNLSPEERQQKHEAEFEKEFEVKIGMLHAHTSGLRLGVVLDSLNDWEPPEVISFRKPSLIEEWNKANPDKAVHLHDRIVRVNNINFHHNAETFIDRIVGQFTAGRKLTEGAKDSLTLQVQRPRLNQIDATRFDFQRKDLHDKMYAKEFTVDLDVPENETSPVSMDSVLGWDLNITNDWDPVSVGKIANGSVLAKWNEAHPSDMILEGDEILHVNKRHWLRNTSQFLPHLTFNYEHRVDHPNGTFALGLRRPRWVQDVYDQAQQVEEQKGKSAKERDILYKKMYSKEFTVSLSIPEDQTSLATMNSVMGWELNSTKAWEPVSIDKIAKGGLLSQWNEANPGDMILEGDEILHVNKRHWLRNTTLFVSHINFNYEHRAALTANGTFNLGLRRPRWVQDAYEQAQLAAQRAVEEAKADEEQAKADEESHRVARKIVDAVRRWNKDFPHHRIDTSINAGGISSSGSSAAVLAGTPASSAAAAEPSSPANYSGGDQDDSDDVIGATEEEDSETSASAPKESAAAPKPSAPASTSGGEQDDSDDVVGATEEEEDSPTSASAPKEPAATAHPSAPASTSGGEQDDSDDVIGATEEEDSATSASSPEESAAAPKPSAPASTSGGDQDDSDDVIGNTEDEDSATSASAPKESAAAPKPSAPASKSVGDQDDSDDVVGATEEEDSSTSASAPKESAAAPKPSAPASTSGGEQDDSDDEIGSTEEEDSATSASAPKEPAATAQPSALESVLGRDQDDSDDEIGSTEEEEGSATEKVRTGHEDDPSFLQAKSLAAAGAGEGSGSDSGKATPDEEDGEGQGSLEEY